MSISERDLETALYSCPHAVHCPSGPVTGWLARQYSVPSGRIDLLGYKASEYELSGVVVELKRGPVDNHALSQVCRYAHDIEQVIFNIANSFGPLPTECAKVYRVVIGSSVGQRELMAADGMGVLICTYRVTLKGSVFVEPHCVSDRRVYETYDRLVSDSPFKMWVNRAREEARLLFGSGQEGEE